MKTRSLVINFDDFSVIYRYNFSNGYIGKFYKKNDSDILYNKVNFYRDILSPQMWKYIVSQLRNLISNPTVDNYYLLNI